jgi:glycosyltransferase involved in cell wall biosynthesis
LRDDQIVFLTFADARSSLARKNPVAAIRAFRAAFTPDDARVALLVKISGDASHDDMLEALKASADGAENIIFLRQDLDQPGVASLMESADVIVSLHRAESLGLVVAEGMARGKAVLTTPWSGVADFIAPDCVASVDYELVPVRDEQGVYQPGQVWAEPSMTSAAAWMVRLRDDAALRAELGARARARAAACLPEIWPHEALGEMFLRCAQRQGGQ